MNNHGVGGTLKLSWSHSYFQVLVTFTEVHTSRFGVKRLGEYSKVAAFKANCDAVKDNGGHEIVLDFTPAKCAGRGTNISDGLGANTFHVLSQPPSGPGSPGANLSRSSTEASRDGVRV